MTKEGVGACIREGVRGVVVASVAWVVVVCMKAVVGVVSWRGGFPGIGST